nr:GAF domain-containing protein [Pseudoalteromonas sp. C2R02]
MLSYLEITQLTCDHELINNHLSALKTYLNKTNHRRDIQWQYKIPELGEGGSCSLFGHLQDEPFDLKSVLLTEHQDIDTNLVNSMQMLTQIVDYIVNTSQVDWFGIYQNRDINNEQGLVKLAYHGAPSRPIFPLTSDFSLISNNVQVALSKKGRVINDIQAYQADGGEYYICDPKVKSEVCLPILTASGEMLGIIDAEAFKTDFFDENTLALLIAGCLLIPNYLPA